MSRRRVARRLARMPSPTTTVARGALGVMALHIADDSFIHPAAGTSASDHLVSGLVPILVLGLAAWAWDRVRPGVAATAGLLLGLFGMTLAAEALYFWRETGLSGDDASGLAAGAAGAALVVTSAVVLWTTRRRSARLAWRYPRRALLGAAGLAGVLLLLAPVLFAYGVTHIARATVPAAHLGVAYEDVTVHTADGLDLAGWYVPSRNGAAVLVYPGRAKAQKHARYLARAGYGVLLVDRRGEGASEGDPHGFGWTFDEDIEAGVRFLAHRDDVDPRRIAGLGLSVGGEMMLQTAADTPGLAAVISDGAGARVLSEELSDVSGLSRVVGAPMYAAKTAALAVFSDHAPPADLTTYIPRIAPRPILLIHAAHGEVDDKTPEYLAAARGPVEQWEVPRGGHTAGIDTMPGEYAHRTLDFLGRWLR
jgi:dienelactone hydrolase